MKTIENFKTTKEGVFTEKEIWGQPDLWLKVYDKIKKEKHTLSTYINSVLADHKLTVILTGAGTSAYIGLSLTGTFTRHFRKHTLAIPTTDLVTHPTDYFSPDQPVLLISFARSGNSPESVAAARLADQLCSKVHHIIITCNGKGELANYNTPSSKYVFVLPEAANDKSLAMTGSYSGMLLTGLLLARISEIDALKREVDILNKYARQILDQADSVKLLANLDFERVVFLGSGPLFGTATESHLKVQELTDGRVICKNDTFLGFRHGPKAVINSKTLVFLLFSNKPYVIQYETDLLESLNVGQKPLYTAGICETAINGINTDKLFILSADGVQLNEEFLPVCYILPAQMIGYYKSLQLGMDPDSPSRSGAISRVVKGVVIYPFENKEK
jgi:tagatose-6-phosphate ketose/aldose isomerase